MLQPFSNGPMFAIPAHKQGRHLWGRLPKLHSVPAMASHPTCLEASSCRKSKQEGRFEWEKELSWGLLLWEEEWRGVREHEWQRLTQRVWFWEIRWRGVREHEWERLTQREWFKETASKRVTEKKKPQREWVKERFPHTRRVSKTDIPQRKRGSQQDRGTESEELSHKNSQVSHKDSLR